MIVRALMILVGFPLVITGVGMTMVGVFAFVGMPMMVIGLGLIIEAADPQS